VNSIIAIPNSEYIACGKDDVSIEIWNYYTGKKISTLKEHKESVNSLVVIPNSEFFASGSDDKTIIIWNYNTMKKVRTLLGHVSSVEALTAIPNTEYLVSGCGFDDTIKIWNYNSGENLKNITVNENYSIISLAWINNTDYIASGSSDSIIKI